MVVTAASFIPETNYSVFIDSNNNVFVGKRGNYHVNRSDKKTRAWYDNGDNSLVYVSADLHDFILLSATGFCGTPRAETLNKQAAKLKEKVLIALS